MLKTRWSRLSRLREIRLDDNCERNISSFSVNNANILLVTFRMEAKSLDENTMDKKTILKKGILVAIAMLQILSALTSCQRPFNSDETRNPIQYETTPKNTTIVERPLVITEFPEEVHKVLDMALNYDHDIRDKGLYSIHVEPPRKGFTKTYNAVFTPIGGDFTDLLNFRFEIDEETYNKFKTLTLQKYALLIGYENNEIAEGLSNKCILKGEMCGPIFDQSTNYGDILNEFIKILQPFAPEIQYYVEDKEQISPEKKKVLENYLHSLNAAYKNGVYSVSIICYQFSWGETLYQLVVYPNKITQSPHPYHKFVQNTSNGSCKINISQKEYEKYLSYKDVSCAIYSENSEGGTTVSCITINFRLQSSSDSLREQVYNSIYNTLTDYKKIK